VVTAAPDDPVQPVDLLERLFFTAIDVTLPAGVLGRSDACPWRWSPSHTAIWQLLVPHLIASIGGAGFHPAAGGLLRSLYPERVRGRMYSILWGGSMVVSARHGLRRSANG
jgi:MFS family permease